MVSHNNRRKCVQSLTYLGLWKTEVSPDQAKRVETAPEEASLSTPIPCSWVHHARLERTDHNSHDVVHISGQDNRLDSETARWKLRNEGITNRANCEVVDESQDKNQSTRSPANRGGQVRNTETTNDHQNDEHGNLTSDVKCATTKVGHQEPGEDSAAETHGALANTERVGVVFAKTGLNHEVGTPADHGRAGGLLDEPGDAGDFGSAEINAFEAVPI